jgi:preprotein translocase subunit SecF
VGLLLGTYSSIYVALPLTNWLDRRFFRGGGGQAARKRRVPRKKEAAVV